MPTSIGQPKRIFFMLICFLLPLSGSGEDLQAQDKPPQSTERLTSQEIMEISELEGIRTRMGGGVTEILKGVVPGSDSEQQIFEMFKRLVKEQESTSIDTFPLQPSMSPATGRTFAAAGARPWSTGAPLGPESANAGSGQQILRSSARTLEGLAAQLEQAKFYDRADELRKTAAQYWVQARSMD